MQSWSDIKLAIADESKDQLTEESTFALEGYFDRLLTKVRDYLGTEHRELFGEAIMNPERQEQLKVVVEGYLRQESVEHPGLSVGETVKRVVDELAGVGPLTPLFEDENVTDILVNGPCEVYVKKNGSMSLDPNIRFRDEATLQNIARKMLNAAGKQVTTAEPIADARLPGTRINVVIPPVARTGTSLSIRRFSKVNLSEEKLINSGLLTEEMMILLKLLVRGGANIVTSGATGSGKTTLIRKLTEYIPLRERIVTIEDTEELRVKDHYPDKNVIAMECRGTGQENTNVSMSRLVRNALRQQPNRIIVGEVRGPEAYDMIEAMNTGHTGSMTTLHANSAQDAIKRLVQMILRAGLNLSAELIRELVMDTIDIVVFQEEMFDGTRRITQIAEVTPDGIRDLYRFDISDVKNGKPYGKHVFVKNTSLSEGLTERLLRKGITEMELDKWIPNGMRGGMVS